VTGPFLQTIAQQQMQAAWSTKPKIVVNLNLSAPKIAVPIEDGTGAVTADEHVTLLADLGSLSISSNHAEAATLSPEEAAIYECYSLLSADLAAYLIKGKFTWPNSAAGAFEAAEVALEGERRSQSGIDIYLGQGAKAIPLLGHCSTTASVHAAHVSHPTLPLIRIGLEVRCCKLHTHSVRCFRRAIWRFRDLIVRTYCSHAGAEYCITCQPVPFDTAPLGDGNRDACERCSD
jgi:hypothetical protein